MIIAVCVVSILQLIDVILVKSDSIVDQPTIRDQKIIRSLGKKYSILVLGWNRGRGLPERRRLTVYPSNFELFNLNAPFGAPSLLPYLPFFWMWVLVRLTRYKPKVVHACDLEAMPPCYLYKKIFGGKLIFDVFDRHAMAYIPRKNIFFKKLHSWTNSLEERLAEGADILVSVSDELIDTFKRKPKNCVPILNCAEDHPIPKLESEKENKFTIAFTGHIRKNRGLEPLVAAIKDLEAVHLVVTGRAEDKELLNKIQAFSNVRYLGFLEHKEVLAIEASSDAIVALYDLDAYVQNKYVMGNKLFEAMMCGVPIITNVASEIVNETQCGIIVDYNNIDQIREVIVSLRDNHNLRKKLADNGRKAFVKEYNWNAMEQKLFKIYQELL
jgi:glycosyltransferase involved in cell wall biosynthesis